MLALTNLGVIHTAISLVAMVSGAIALIRHKDIPPNTFIGRLYIWTTIVTCLTGFPIMQHGGFGAPHALGIITLLVLIVAAVAGKTELFGGASRYVETISYSATFLFHWIPAIVETSTRLPVGAPLVTDREGPEIQAATGVVVLLFMVGVAIQILRLRKASPAK